jgi:hypothetical protein
MWDLVRKRQLPEWKRTYWQQKVLQIILLLSRSFTVTFRSQTESYDKSYHYVWFSVCLSIFLAATIPQRFATSLQDHKKRATCLHNYPSKFTWFFVYVNVITQVDQTMIKHKKPAAKFVYKFVSTLT